MWEVYYVAALRERFDWNDLRSNLLFCYRRGTDTRAYRAGGEVLIIRDVTVTKTASGRLPITPH